MRTFLIVALVLAAPALARKRRPMPDQPIASTTPPELFGAFRYQFSQSERSEIASGRTIVSVIARGHTPWQGWFPMRVKIDNTQGPAQQVKLAFRTLGSASSEVTKTVEVNAGELQNVTLSVPAETRYGTFEASSPVIGRQSGQVGFSSVYEDHRLVLNFGTPEQFEAFIQEKPDNTSGEDQVVAMALEEAPNELAGYLGVHAVTVTDPRGLEALSEVQRRALEGWVSLGGTLVLTAWPRGWGVLPLLHDDGDEIRPYGFGVVAVPTGNAPLTWVPKAVLPLTPMAGDASEIRNGSSSMLLPQAQVPVGRFLLIITLFTLLIGPGSVWLARRRGPAVLLASIPATAFATCVVILGSSLLLDGFTVHASSYGYTLLDRDRNRAITVGLSAWYANLAPRSVTFDAATALVAPGRNDGPAIDLDWSGDGARLKSGFIPSRTYREWGIVSVTPTRARLVVKQRGDQFVVQNALGHRVGQVWVRLGDQLYVARELSDGREATLQPDERIDDAALDLTAGDRFASTVRPLLMAPLTDGQFMAKLEGVGFVPLGGVRFDLYEGAHVVRGEVER